MGETESKTAPPTGRPRLALHDPGFWFFYFYGRSIKFRLEDGPFRPAFGFLLPQPEFIRLLSEHSRTLPMLGRFMRGFYASFVFSCLGAFGIALAIGVRTALPDARAGESLELWIFVLMASLLCFGLGLLLAKDVHRGVHRMVEAYNGERKT